MQIADEHVPLRATVFSGASRTNDVIKAVWRLKVCLNDPWLEILGELYGSGTALDRLTRNSARDGLPCNAQGGLVISRIEWQTSCTILVSWSDSTRGRYVDQTWRLGYARTAGVCRLTGVPVRRGDPVFRPLYRKDAEPTNARDMILASGVTAA